MNDNAPEFLSEEFSVSIPEDVKAGQHIIRNKYINIKVVLQSVTKIRYDKKFIYLLCVFS